MVAEEGRGIWVNIRRKESRVILEERRRQWHTGVSQRRIHRHWIYILYVTNNRFNIFMVISDHTCDCLLHIFITMCINSN